MRKKLGSILAVAAASVFVGVGAASAQNIDYTVSGTLTANGSDSEGLNGAALTVSMSFDSTGFYGDRFGLPSVLANIGSPMASISGSSNGANNTTTPFTTDIAFYPTFAGIFSDPAGGQPQFTSGSGTVFLFIGNMSATPGAANAVIGGAIELDDFAPGAVYGGGANALTNQTTGESYTFDNVRIEAVIPAPGVLALLGIAGFAARRRRRN